MKLNFIIKFTVLTLTLGLLGQNASAEQVRDMFFKNFSPHTNNCDMTETFESVGSGSLGFCIDNDEKSADTWENAKNSCFSDGKRLPEPAEWAIACKRASGAMLTSMTNGWEWSSNSSQIIYFPSEIVLGSAIMGYSTCVSASTGAIGSDYSSAAGNSQSFNFRCVK